MRSPLILHVGLTLSEEQQKDKNLVHCPMVNVVPVPKTELPSLDTTKVTHVIFTSKTAVALWIDYFGLAALSSKQIISVGRATTRKLEKQGLHPFTAEEECAEGIVKLLQTLDLRGAVLLWPHAAGARSVISDYCAEKKIPLIAPILYETVPKRPDPLPNLAKFDKIYFSSPSSVHAFFTFFPEPPPNLQFETIGAITQISLDLIKKTI
jgi:uroporphyrinogen-III synthase